MYWCETCQEGKHTIGDCVQGCSLTRWAKPAEQWCAMPAPHCLKPAIGGNRWDYGGKVDPAGAQLAERQWLLARVS